MKKSLLIIAAVLLVSAAGAWADTVLLCISDNKPELERDDWSPLLMRAVEDGAMEVFFEAGHIVTNTVIDNCGPELVSRLARENGAGIILMLTLIYPETAPDNLPVPDRLEYMLFGSDGKEIMPPGDMAALQPRGGTVTDILDMMAECGRQLAVNAASEASGGW